MSRRSSLDEGAVRCGVVRFQLVSRRASLGAAEQPIRFVEPALL